MNVTNVKNLSTPIHCIGGQYNPALARLLSKYGGRHYDNASQELTSNYNTEWDDGSQEVKTNGCGGINQQLNYYIKNMEEDGKYGTGLAAEAAWGHDPYLGT